MGHRDASTCEVGWPVPILAAFFSPVLPPGTFHHVKFQALTFHHEVELLLKLTLTRHLPSNC